jgi:hypothetical protein
MQVSEDLIRNVYTCGLQAPCPRCAGRNPQSIGGYPVVGDVIIPDVFISVNKNLG